MNQETDLSSQSTELRRDLRADALACLQASVLAVEPKKLVAGHLTSGLALNGPVHVASIGKAAGAMAAGAREALGERLVGGVVIAPDGVVVDSLPEVGVHWAGHPMPDERGVRGAEAVLQMAERLGEKDLLLCLISGGGSALMTLPPVGVTLEEVRATTDLLLRAGAPIHELNCVRKHLDLLKGGRLARAAAPARVLGLLLSDVIGNPPDVIASGPLSCDTTTFAAAVAILEKRDVWEAVPVAIRKHFERGLTGEVEESPKADDPCFRTVEVRIVGSNELAAEAALREAERRGYRTRLVSTAITGEARETGSALAALGKEVRHRNAPFAAPACLVAAGETTVTVRGQGKGGRNQELTLGAAVELAGERGILVGSMGTDGIDGPTDAAGAFADGTTVERAREKGLDPADALARNDSYPFFHALGDLIVTGPTGTNVMDIQVVLVDELDDR